MKRFWRLCGLVTGWLFGRESYDPGFPTRERRGLIYFDGPKTTLDLLRELRLESTERSGESTPPTPLTKPATRR